VLSSHGFLFFLYIEGFVYDLRSFGRKLPGLKTLSLSAGTLCGDIEDERRPG
jgi:hypothetical protein